MHLRELMQRGPYQAYAYAYPHKTAYRDLPQPIPLQRAWAAEDREALFAYVHVPFCSYRCGFCNLFALGNPAAELVDRYVDQVVRQLNIVGPTLGQHRCARFALGGGTPSYLQAEQLERIFNAVMRELTIDLQAVPAGIEVSPETATRDRLQVCRDVGCDRVSMGVQSFVESELQALVRPTQRREVVDAIENIRRLGFATLNLDLIYGIHGQSVASFVESVRTALQFVPEELYLYPLYVRARTGLGKIEASRGHAESNDVRLQMYAAARDKLLDAGYTQVSMRMFRSPNAPDVGGPAYCCQNDGMVGFGCGARSYTRALHYSDHYGVSRASVSSILQQFVSAPASSFAEARYGFVLDADEQRRRFVIQSLLVWPGLEEASYTSRFGTRVFDDLPQLEQLIETGVARNQHGLLALTEQGMAHADTIGPWLASQSVIARMSNYEAA
jgi:oxygen-independent coproporphyrinogen III oxidase